MGKAYLRCWSSSSCPLWPVMSLLKGLITVMPGGKVVQRPDGWLESWFASTKGFDVAVKLVLTSRVCLIIKSWLSVCTSVYWLRTRIKVLYCAWSIKIFYKTWSECHNYLTFSIRLDSFQSSLDREINALLETFNVLSHRKRLMIKQYIFFHLAVLNIYQNELDHFEIINS